MLRTASSKLGSSPYQRSHTADHARSTGREEGNGAFFNDIVRESTDARAFPRSPDILHDANHEHCVRPFGVTPLGGPGGVRVLAAHEGGQEGSIIMTTRKRHTPEQVVRKLVEADRLLAGGADTAEVARQLGVSEQTYFRWRNQFGGLKTEDAKELKKLRAENQRLKRLLADAELDKDMLREVAKGEF